MSSKLRIFIKKNIYIYFLMFLNYSVLIFSFLLYKFINLFKIFILIKNFKLLIFNSEKAIENEKFTAIFE
jgi:hypothetical protein